MSDQSLLLAAPEELPLEEEDEVPSEDTSPDEPVASSDTSEFLTESTDTEDDQNQASDEWKQMWSAKRGESAEPQVVTENAFNDAVSQVINGINITYNNAGGAPGRRKSTSAPISHDRLEKNSRVYVPPSNGLDQALNVLVERRVLILFGERRMGKK